MPSQRIKIQNRQTGGFKNVIIDYFMDSFPHNCGYRVLNKLTASDNYSSLSETDKRSVLREFLKSLVHSTPRVKKIVVTANKYEWPVTYDLIKKCGLQIGTPTTPNGSGREKIIMGEINPYNQRSKYTKKYRLSKYNEYKIIGSTRGGVW